MYRGTLTDKKNHHTVKFSHKSIYEIMTQFSMMIEDTKLEQIQIKIVKKEDGKV
jgi:hypothetical protein